jgi:transposase
MGYTGMANSNRIDEINKKIRQLKKAGVGKNGDLRTLVRLMALLAYYKGRPLEVVAQCFGVSIKSLKRWIGRYEGKGIGAVCDESRSGRPPKLPPEQQGEIKKIVEESNQRVWVARHLVALIQTLHGVLYSVGYLPQLLKKLGLSFHKAVASLVKRDSEKRRVWVRETLPEIYKKKIRDGWRIFYQDEAGFQTEGTLASTWGVRGRETAIANYGRHGRMNVIGAFELGTGQFYGIQTSFRVDAMRFRRFICHLKWQMRTDKILLICDNARFHKAKWLTAWVGEQKDWLQLSFLPPYSPDFNPIERLWRWMKTEYTHNRCWESKRQLKEYLRDVLKDIPTRAESMKSIMQAEIERYKTICDFYAAEPETLSPAPA